MRARTGFIGGRAGFSGRRRPDSLNHIHPRHRNGPPGIHMLERRLLLANLLVNGDFSLGDTGFSTEYPKGYGGYAVTSDPQSVNGALASFGDHTTGKGRMLLVDGANDSSKVVWQQTVPLKTGGHYVFSGYAASAYAMSPAKISVTINGAPVGLDLSVPWKPGEWVRFTGQWDTFGSKQATIRITDRNRDYLGNDFVLDDLKFVSAGKGISMLKDVYPGAQGSYPQQIATIPDGTAYFIGTDAAHGRELWFTDGSWEGTQLVMDINPGPASSDPDSLTVVDGTVYFSADDGTHGRELWRSSYRRPGGTHMVLEISPGNTPGSEAGGSWGPERLTPLGDTLYFTCADPVGGERIWRSDGTAAGTRAINPAGGAVSYQWLTPVGDTLYFDASTYSNGLELWRTDGTDAGTVMVKDINVSSYGADSYPWGLTAVGNEVYFGADDGVHGYELWKSDGTEAGTVMVKDINPGPGRSMETYNQYYFGVLGNSVYLAADDGTHGLELWKSDGTDAGTVMLQDIWPGAGASNPFPIRAVGDTLYFPADDGVYGQELWRSDGTSTGTWMVRDINVGSQGSGPNVRDMTWIGPTLFFAARDYLGYEFWCSNGTPESTRLQTDLHRGDSLYPGWGGKFVTVGTQVLFAGDDGASGYELWWTFGGPGPGTVTVSGTAGNDTIRVRRDGDFLNVLVNGKLTQQPYDRLANFVVNGLAGNDSISVDASVSLPATLNGGAGNDTLTGNAQMNTLNGDDGNDRLVGGGGQDHFFGGAGNDTLIGGTAADHFYGGDGTDTADYSARTENLRIGVGTFSDDGAPRECDNLATDIEILIGGSGNDTIQGGDAANLLFGGPGNDQLFGGRGRDTLDGGAGADYLAGGPGTDTLDYSKRAKPLNVTLGSLADDGEAAEGDNAAIDIEIVFGGSGNDRLVANWHGVTLQGRAGNDTILGGNGVDVLSGGSGNDSLDGGRESDYLEGGAGNDTISAGFQPISSKSGPVSDTLMGQDGDDWLYARDDYRDTVDGGNGYDRAQVDPAFDLLVSIQQLLP